MKIQASLAPSTPRSLPATAKLDTPSNEGDSFRPSEAPKGFLRKAGDRLLHGAKNGALHTALATASLTLPWAVTSAISAAVPGWIPYGGMLGNILVGGAVGAAVGQVGGNMLNHLNGWEGQDAADQKRTTTVIGAALGAFGGFGGVLSAPGVTIHDPNVFLLQKAVLGTSAGLFGAIGAVEGIVNGPPER